MRGRSLKRYTQSGTHVQHVIHADGTQTKETNHTTPTAFHPSPRIRKQRIIVAGIMTAVVVIGLLVFRLVIANKVQDPQVQLTDISVQQTKQLVTDALPQLTSEDYTNFEATIEKINAVQGNEIQPTLLYLKLRYYIAISDTTNARKTYNALINAYDPAVGYDEQINSWARSLEDLKTDVEFLEQQDAQFKKNVQGLQG